MDDIMDDLHEEVEGGEEGDLSEEDKKQIKDTIKKVFPGITIEQLFRLMRLLIER